MPVFKSEITKNSCPKSCLYAFIAFLDFHALIQTYSRPKVEFRPFGGGESTCAAFGGLTIKVLVLLKILKVYLNMA